MKRILLFLLTLSLPCWGRKETPSCLIALIDTTYRTEASYRSLIKLSEADGITIRFTHPSIKLEQELCGCDGVFLALDDHFLNHTESAYAQLTIKPLKMFFKQNKKLFGLLLPPAVINNNQISAVMQFLKMLDLNEPAEPDIQTFIQQQHLFKPLYTTQNYLTQTTKLPKPKFVHAQGLPTKTIPSYLDNNWPIGILISSANRYLFITTLRAMTFSDLVEDSARNPIDPSKRKELLNASLSSLYTLSKKLYTNKNNCAPQPNKIALTTLVGNARYKHNYAMYKKQQGIYQWTSNGIACGWMSVDYDKKLMPQNLAYLAQTDLDMLWLELPIGLYKKSDEFDQKISLFTTALQKAYKKEKRNLPKIFLDFDFGATLYWCTDSSHPIDIYGNKYQKIPAPLDYQKFWRPCILTVLKNVCDRWEKSIGNKVPIDGILFNFYFWNAKETMPFYTNLVDFSDSAWSAYQKHYKAPDISTRKERINYLLNNDKLTEYFIALEREAYELAQLIINDIRTILPCAMIGAYSDTPLDVWFYRGIMRGLSSKQNPLLWFTSNLNFYGHQNWIKFNNIQALHVTNILLNHFNEYHDIRMINKLAHTHDGLWYSRVSRIGEKYQSDKWWSAEATTLEPKRLIKLINKQTHKK